MKTNQGKKNLKFGDPTQRTIHKNCGCCEKLFTRIPSEYESDTLFHHFICDCGSNITIFVDPNMKKPSLEDLKNWRQL